MPRNSYITVREAAYLTGRGVTQINGMCAAGRLPNSRHSHGTFDVSLGDLVSIGFVEAALITACPTQSARCQRGAVNRKKRRADRFRPAGR